MIYIMQHPALCGRSVCGFLPKNYIGSGALCKSPITVSEKDTGLVPENGEKIRYNKFRKKETEQKSRHDSLFKMLYLAMKDITKKWTGRRQDWSRIYAQLVIYYGDRIPE